MYHFKLMEVRNKDNAKGKWTYSKTYFHALRESHADYSYIFLESSFIIFLKLGEKKIYILTL